MLSANAPFHINWNYTYICNFNCEHCYTRTHDSSDELGIAGRRKVAINIAHSQVFSVNLGGGEPLLCSDIYDNIALLANNNLHVMLSSNGWRTTPGTVQKLANAGLGAVILSIDSSVPNLHDSFRNKPGSYQSVLNSIAIYRELGIPVIISTIITSQNFDDLEGIIALAAKQDCQSAEFKRLRLMGNASDRNDLLLSTSQEVELYTKIADWKQRYPIQIGLVYGVKPVEGIDSGCPCGKSILCVLANGDLAPCVYNPRIIGNALTDDIDKLWRTSPQLLYMREHFTCHGLE